MSRIEDILQLRKKVRQLEEDASNLAIFASSSEEADAYDRLAMELHDVDTALFNAVFIKNDSKIVELLQGIQEAGEKAAQVRTQLAELTNIFKKARATVKNANNFAGKAKDTLEEIETLLVLLDQPVQ